MFGFLRRLRRPRRAIFAFELNGKRVHRDPVKVRQKLAAANPQWAELVGMVTKAARPLPEKLAAAGGELLKKRRADAEAAAADLAVLTAQAFDVPELDDDGRGMTRAELIGLMADYIGWCAGVMRATRPLAPSPAGTASPAGV